MTQLQPVPALSSIGMLFSLIVSMGLPIVLCLLLYKKAGAKLSSLAVGCASFFLFAMVLEQVLHTIVLKTAGTVFTQNIWLYALYGGLAAAVFEETGRYVMMKHFMKKDLDRKNALMYGVGHGGIEAVMLVGMTYFSYIVTAVMINNGKMQASLSTIPAENLEATVQSFTALATLPSWQYFMAGIERIQAIGLHIALSVIVYRALKTGKIQYYLIAMAMHFVVDFITLIASNFVPIPVIELIVFVMVVLVAFYAWKLYKADEAETASAR